MFLGIGPIGLANLWPTEPPVSFGLWDLNSNVHPWRLTCNIVMEVWKIMFLSKWVICRFKVKLPGCNSGWPPATFGLSGSQREGPWEGKAMRWFTRELIFRQALSRNHRNLPWEPMFPSFFRGYDPYILGPKTFIFHGSIPVRRLKIMPQSAGVLESTHSQ